MITLKKYLIINNFFKIKYIKDQKKNFKNNLYIKSKEIHIIYV